MSEERIRDLASRLSRDVETLDNWTVGVVRVNPSETDDDGIHKYEIAITVSSNGQRRLQLEFFQGEDLDEQTLEALNQLQDVIVERDLLAWPPCPQHSHVLVPNTVLGEFYWVCPDDSKLMISVGDLKAADLDHLERNHKDDPS